MSKIMKYTQSLYGGKREGRELKVSDDAVVYIAGFDYGESVSMCNVLVRTSEKTEADRCFLIGEFWFTFLLGIDLDGCEIPCKRITECEPPKDSYIVFVRKSLYPHRTAFDLLEQCKGEDGTVDWTKVKELSMEPYAVSKIRRFTERGIEVTHVHMKDMARYDYACVELHTWGYDYTWGCIRSSDFGNFFTTEEKYKQLFNDKLEEYYKLFKE